MYTRYVWKRQALVPLRYAELGTKIGTLLVHSRHALRSGCARFTFGALSEHLWISTSIPHIEQCAHLPRRPARPSRCRTPAKCLYFGCPYKKTASHIRDDSKVLIILWLRR